MRKILAVSGMPYAETANIRGIEHELMGGFKVIRFVTEIIDCSRPTRNGVLYPLEEFKKAINNDRITDMLSRRSFYGEMHHPLYPEDMNRWVEPVMDRVTHRWTKLWFEGNKLMGECETFSGNGNLLMHAIIGGELPAFSIRVIGNPQRESNYTKLTDITLLAIDWVRYPGNPTSYVDDSEKFKIKEADLYNGFSLSKRKIQRVENASVLGLKDNEGVVPLGKGYFAVMEGVSASEKTDILKNRLKSFTL